MKLLKYLLLGGLIAANMANAGPLHDAARVGSMAKANEYLAQGENPFVAELSGLTAYDLALLAGYSRMTDAFELYRLPDVSSEPSKALVRSIQTRLTVLHYDPGQVDGLFGFKTRSAIEAFQTDNQLPVTGSIEVDWMTTLRENLVKYVQESLLSLGFDPGPADGAIGSKTRSAIDYFTSERGITIVHSDQLSDRLLGMLRGVGVVESKPVVRKPVPTVSEGGEVVARGPATGEFTEHQGAILFRWDSDDNVIGCTIDKVALDLEWCDTFDAKPGRKNCILTLRPNGKVMSVRCK